MSAIGWFKPALFVLSLVPFLRLFVLGFLGGLGANPIEFITQSTGFWALTFLCLTLTVTPLRRLTGWAVLIRVRRMLGLFAFFYACAHLVTYVWFDQWFSLEEIVKDIWKRPFITIGFTAFLLLVPLAVTSTNRMMRRLGRRWAQLHRLVYLIVILGVVHFWWLKQDKNDLSEPTWFTAVVFALLLFRVAYPFWKRAANARKDGAAPAWRAFTERGDRRWTAASAQTGAPAQSCSRRSTASSAATVSRSRTT